MGTDHPEIIFDRPPPSAARLGFTLTPGRAYPLRAIDAERRLYEVDDDGGRPMRVSLYGRTWTNNGYWHLREDESQLAANA